MSIKKILHVFYTRGSFYPKSFLRFLNLHKSLSDGVSHFFFFENEEKWTNFSVGAGKVVSGLLTKGIIEKLFGIIKSSLNTILRTLKAVSSSPDLIILHSLPIYFINIISFSIFPIAYKRLIWSTWGADIYDFFKDINSDSTNTKVIGSSKTKLKISITQLINILLQMLRFIRSLYTKRIIKRAKAIITVFPGDYLAIKKIIPTSANRLVAFYPNPVDWKIMESLPPSEKNKKEKTILLGNSAWPTNDHLEAIDCLSKLQKTVQFKVICPLSYGNRKYALMVSKYGKERLGDDFMPLLEYLKPMDYARIINSVDVALMNHRRQQAVGNIILLLYAQKKVYIKRSVSTYSFLKQLGIQVYDMKKLLQNNPTSEIFAFDQRDGQKNSKIISIFFSDNNCVQMWEDIFLNE